MIYATREDNRRRVLVELECDECDATIKPHPEIAQSGWRYAETDDWRMDYCPDCWDKHGWKYEPNGDAE